MFLHCVPSEIDDLRTNLIAEVFIFRDNAVQTFTAETAFLSCAIAAAEWFFFCELPISVGSQSEIYSASGSSCRGNSLPDRRVGNYASGAKQAGREEECSRKLTG